jgi:hypothetical protein
MMEHGAVLFRFRLTLFLQVYLFPYPIDSLFAELITSIRISSASPGLDLYVLAGGF